MRRFINIMALVLCCTLFLSACGGSRGEENKITASAKKDPDTLIYAMSMDPAKLDPQNDYLLTSMFVNKQIYNTLVVKDSETGEIAPGLATEWSWTDDTTLALTIRDDVYFHNGEKLTAEDVLYTIQRFPQGSATATLFSSFDGKNSKVIDPTHIEIKLKGTYGPALNMLTSMKAAIVNKKYCESVDETQFSREPIGTGAFKFVSWVSGDRITLVKNEKYWGETPSYSNLILRVIIDSTARAIELETGGVDIVDTLNGKDIDRFKAGVDGVNLHLVPGYKTLFLVFNEKDPILSNEKVRLAFAHAIDMEPIIKTAFGSSAIPASSTMATTIFGYKNKGFYEYNPELAKQLLKEAGYPDGFSVEIILPDEQKNVRAGEAMQAMLAEVGIKMDIKIFDAATWLSMNREGTAMLSIHNLTVDTGDADHAYTYLYGKGNVLSARSSDPYVNELLNKGRTELDQNKRLEIYGELQDYMFDHAIWIPVSEPVISFGVKDYIKNFTPDAGVQVDLSKITINK